jgi:hypothetical protein
MSSRRLRPSSAVVALQIQRVVVADLAGRPVLESISFICTGAKESAYGVYTYHKAYTVPYDTSDGEAYGRQRWS